jgi:hypothetical protein
MPLSPPDSVEPVYVDLVNNSTTATAQYSAGSTALSTSSPVSVTVFSCDAGAVSQWLDGSAVTQNTLRSMLSVSVSMNGDAQFGNWAVTASFTPDASVFRFLPRFTYFPLQYVIKHTRGTKHRYSTFQVLVRQVNVPDTLPEGGLPAFLNNPSPYSNSPFTRTQPEFGGALATARTAVIYSDNAVLDDIYSAAGVQLPAVEIEPTGAQLNHTEYAVQATNAQYLSLQSPTSNVISRGWIMRPRDPAFLLDFQFNNWIYDTERVADWLNGEGTVPYNSGQFISPTDSSWTMQVSDPVAFCGYPLCTPIGFLGGAPTGFLGGAMYGGIVSNTMTVQTAKFPSTYTSTDEKGTTTYTNPCYGLDAAPVVTARLLPSGCQYSGSYSSCENPSSLNNAWVRNRGQPVRVFYCGDLLWAIEHGPCRNTLTIPYLNWGNETYTIGGNDSDPSQNNRRCHVSFTQNEGVCMPYEATLTLNQQYQIRCYAGASLYIGDALTGDIVCSAVGSSGAGYLTASGGCTSQVFSGVIPFQQAPGRTEYGGMLPLTIVRKRDKWCDEWANNVELWFSTGCFCGLVPGSCAATVPSGSPFFAVIDASVAFGASTSPLPNTASVSTASLPKQGGTVTLTYCCPERQETRVIGPHSGRYPRSFNIESSGSGLPGSGITAYVTQAGYDGVECPFTVMWLSGSVISLGSKSRAFAATGEPIMGQINHSEQPGCPWSVVESANWIVAEQTVDGLLKVSINGNVAAVYGPSDSKYTHPYREATVTISSGGSTDTWEIVQFQP